MDVSSPELEIKGLKTDIQVEVGNTDLTDLYIMYLSVISDI